jgi:glycosyltransferase involved in cell wall biosynthesis
VLLLSHPDGKLPVERSKMAADAGFDVTWFWWWKPKLDLVDQATWLSRRVFLPPLGRSRGLVAPARFLFEHLRSQPCVVHLHYALTGADQERWMRLARPLIVTAMGGDIFPDQGFRGEFVEPTTRLLQRADIVTSKSRFMDARLQELGVAPERIRRITWGLDLSRFRSGLDTRALAREHGVSVDDTVFFCPRMCVANSNKDLVLRAFARCVDRVKGKRRAKLLVSEYLGDRACLDSLHRLAGELEVGEHVRFVGEIPSDRMPEYYNLADAVVSVARSDGMPQTVYQAAACGSFLLLGDIPQLAELYDLGVQARRVSVADERELADAMCRVANHRRAARESGLANRAAVLPLADQQQQSQAMARIYEELLERSLPRRLGL